MIQSYCAPRSSPVRSCTAYWTSGTKPSGRIEAHLSRSCRRRRAATRSPRRPTTGAGEAAASGRGPTRPPAPARAPWGHARVFGDLDAWIWQVGRRRRAEWSRYICDLLLQKWVSCSCRSTGLRLVERWRWRRRDGRGGVVPLGFGLIQLPVFRRLFRLFILFF